MSTTINSLWQATIINWKQIVAFIKKYATDIYAEIMVPMRSIPSDIAVEIRVGNMTYNDKRVDGFVNQSRDAWEAWESGEMHDQIEWWVFRLQDVLSYALKHVDRNQQDKFFKAIHGIIDMQRQYVWARSDKYKLNKKTVASIDRLKILSQGTEYQPLFAMSNVKKAWIGSTILLAAALWLSTISGPDQDQNIDHSPDSSIHIAKKWDTWYSMHVKYGVAVEELKKINNTDSNIIGIGQQIKIPQQGQ